jgi:peptide/nickel transport system substrate-binding protein
MGVHMSSKIRFKSLVGLALAVGLLWSLACGGAEEATPTPTATTAPAPQATTAAPEPAATATPTPDTSMDPKYGGIIQLTDTVRSLDIGTVAGNPGEYNQMQGWMSQLIRVNLSDRKTIEGDLAESWTVSDDGTEYTFKLRDNLIDHSGKRWTADDVAYAVWKIIARPVDDPLRRILCWEQGAAEADPNGPAAGTAVEITGELEFVVRTHSPIAWYPACMAQHFSLIGPGDGYRKIVAEGEFRELSPEDGELIGTGPFTVKEYDRGSKIVFERFDNFFRDGLPYIDGFEITHVPELATKIAAVAAGRSEGWIYGPCCQPNLSDIAPLKRQYGEEFVVPQSFAFGTASYIVNMQRPPFGPQDDPTARQLRKAVQLHIDRLVENELIYEGLGFQIFFYYCGFDWIHSCDEWLAFPGHAEDEMKKEEERQEARDIMTSLGYGPDNMLEIELLTAESGSGRRGSELLQEELKDMYIEAKLRVPPGGESVYDDQFAGRFDLVYDVSGYALEDPVIFDQNKYLPLEDGSENYGRWVNQEWLSLYEQQLTVSDQAERGRIYQEMVEILFEDLPILPMNRFRPPHPYMAYVRNWTPKRLHASSASLEQVWLTPDDRQPWPEQAATDIFDTGQYELR